MSTPTPTIRTVEIASPSSRGETLHVLRALFFIAIAAGVVVAIHRGGAKTEPTPADEARLYPFVRRFTSLPAADQRIFTLLREGIGEAERRRSSSGRWPDARSLADDGIPPFASDPIDRDVSWTSRVDGRVANYVGTPRAGSKRGAFLVILVEPEPGPVVGPATPADEVHHRLGDGLMVHVSVHYGEGLEPPPRAVATVSFTDGWQQVLVGSPTMLLR